MALVHKQNIPTKRPLLVSEVNANFHGQGCRMVSAVDPHGHNLDFLDQRHYSFFQVAPQLYPRGLVDPVPDPLLLRNSGRAWYQTRDLWICSQEL
jgi:hypothetical protein